MDQIRRALHAQIKESYGPCLLRYDDHVMIFRIWAVPQFITYIRNDDGENMMCYYAHEDDLLAAGHEHGEYRCYREQQCYRMFRRYKKPTGSFNDFLTVTKHYLTCAVANMRAHPLPGHKRPLTIAEADWRVKNIVVPDPRTEPKDREDERKYKKPRAAP